MGLSSKKSSSQSTSTYTPNNPQWVTDAMQSFTGNLQGLASADPRSFVAPASALQEQGFGLIGHLGAQAPGWMNSAANTAQGLTNYQPQQVSALTVDPQQAFASFGAANPMEALTRTLSGRVDNPYLAGMNQANINQALQGYDDALTSATNNLNRSVLPGIRSGAILSGQYGGSRQGIAEGVALGDFGAQAAQNARNLAQSAMDSGNRLYGGAYESAQDRMANTANNLAGLSLQNAQGNADRSLQAQLANQSAGLQGANLNLNAAQQLSGMGQYGLNALGDWGGVQRDIAQQYAQAPLNVAQALAGAYGQMPYNLFQGNTTTSSTTGKEKGLNFSMDDAARIAAFALSDPRFKRDIERVGTDVQGRNVYEFNYLTDPPGTPPATGVMADEVALTDPEAVAVGPDGYMRVDYDRLNAKNQATVTAARTPSLPKPFSDPTVLFDGPYQGPGAELPKPFSDPRVLMKGWRPAAPAPAAVGGQMRTPAEIADLAQQPVAPRPATVRWDPSLQQFNPTVLQQPGVRNAASWRQRPGLFGSSYANWRAA